MERTREPRMLWPDCLTKLDLEPVVLHEQPNQGRTIIEKFEEYAQVGFAVVLLTPDDRAVATANRTAFSPARGRT